MAEAVVEQKNIIEIIDKIGSSEDKVIALLQAIQKQYNYLPEKALRILCEETGISKASVVGVSTFYSQFRHKPAGEHTINVCKGTACHVKGADLVIDSLYRELSIPQGDDTDPSGKYTIEKVSCLGCCTLAPVVQIDGITFGHVTAESVPDMLNEFITKMSEDSKEKIDVEITEDFVGEVRLGMGSCCIAGGSGEIKDEVDRVVGQLIKPVKVKPVGCVGMCHQTPLMEVIDEEGISHQYARVQSRDVEEILHKHFKPQFFKDIFAKTEKAITCFCSGESWDRVKDKKFTNSDSEIKPFISQQVHIATEQCGEIKPLDLKEYHLSGGFDGAKKALAMSEDDIIAEIEKSGIRGRGGAGFPTGTKWRFVKGAKNDKKYVICNGDEGDPGAFMDRMLLESYPYRVLEGMIIAAKAVGASDGILYIRAEYPLAVSRIRDAIKDLEHDNWLGDNIQGSGFSLKLKIKEGAGAFVCGEETALLKSIEGERGMPVVKPPFPAIEGLWKKPTLVNNVETLSLLSWIIRHGAEEFRTFGTEKSKGTKVFALAGKIRRGGLIEVPMGITVKQIVEDIGGGIAGNRKLKAVQVGGPSGGCIPADKSDVPVDFESLTSMGAMMGSGGMVVLDENDCMVDIARYFLSFTQSESCGKCTFCRVGTKRMLEIMERICAGDGKDGDLELLEKIGKEVKENSLCGLGKTAPNPVLSTLRYFRDEYEAHLRGECPAGKCPQLIRYEIDDSCTGCTICADKCATNAIIATPYKVHVVIDDLCTRCDTCRQVCPQDSVKVVSGKLKEVENV